MKENTEREKLEADYKKILSDPVAVRINWLRGDIAAGYIIDEVVEEERERCIAIVSEFVTTWGLAYKTMIDQISDALTHSTPK